MIRFRNILTNMNKDQLRALIKEEIDNVLAEEASANDHASFRKRVSKKLKRSFKEGESYDETWVAWQNVLAETAGERDVDVVEYYANEVAAKLR